MSNAHHTNAYEEKGRDEALGRLVDEVIRRRHEGEPLTDDQTIAENPTLMPALAKRLNQLATVQNLRYAPDQSETTATATSPVVGFRAIPEDWRLRIHR